RRAFRRARAADRRADGAHDPRAQEGRPHGAAVRAEHELRRHGRRPRLSHRAGAYPRLRRSCRGARTLRVAMSWIAGVDVGGTFTDLIALDGASGETRLAKVPTTPQNQAFGVLAALEQAGVRLAELDLLVH